MRGVGWRGTTRISPTNHDKVYAGLEEVFQSSNGGGKWITASPYWNYGLACGSSCPTAAIRSSTTSARAVTGRRRSD